MFIQFLLIETVLTWMRQVEYLSDQLSRKLAPLNVSAVNSAVGILKSIY